MPAEVLSGNAATRDLVLAKLASYPVAHFACHAVSGAPDASRLVISDDEANPLTVAAISNLDLPHADLAYLSACSTRPADTAEAAIALHNAI